MEASFECNSLSSQVFLIFKVNCNYLFIKQHTVCRGKRNTDVTELHITVLGQAVNAHLNTHPPQPCLACLLLEVTASLNLPAVPTTRIASQPTSSNPYSLAKVYCTVQPIIFKWKPQAGELSNCVCAYAVLPSSRAQEGGHHPLSWLCWI